jgi:NAD(P) transhydrogenase subunit alpha
MKVGVPKEIVDGERRVALVPEVIKKMAAKGFEFVVEPGAGSEAMLSDTAYEEAGATLSGDVWSADVVAKVAAPTDEEIAKLGDSTVLVGFLGPLTNVHATRGLAAAGATSFAMEAIPRISRAQAMDALSSQSNVAGYKSVLLATQHIGRFFPMMMTAAGTVPPARVLVLGAGEGAEGEGGYARELTDEEKAAQQTELADKIATFDVVITTALVPGRRAPILVTARSVEKMKPGSVIVDLAGESGGNCELTEPGEVVVKHAVTIVSPLNLPASMPEHSSALYARNVQSLLELLVDDEGALSLNFDDEIVAGACITRDGEIVHAGAKKAVEAEQGDAEPPAPSELAPTPEGEEAPEPEVAAPKTEEAQ